MKRIIGKGLLLLFLAGVCSGQNIPQPNLVSSQLPKYPPLARMTRTQGEVKVEFVLNSSGEPQSVVAVSGHPLLRAAAEENVKSWRFELPKDLYRTEWKYSTTFNFKISDEQDPYENAKLTVVMNSFQYVEVITNPPSNKYAHNCPSKEDAQPPTGSLSNGDFVKLSRSPCYGTCPAYEVTVSENGDITWNGIAFVHSSGVVHSRIGAAAAQDLIQQFQASKFWGLCGGYDASITDSPTTQIDLQIGSRSKTVWNYANSAPDWVETFEDSIDSVADTHIWRHGEPRIEPLSNIFQDSVMPKPGVTPLMKASTHADIRSMEANLGAGLEVDAADSSNWTALMYASASGHSEPVRMLLKAGANPNHKSFNGDTPLMASAISGQFDGDLFRAGAEIDAKNSYGVTALMILATKGDADEIRDALEAGADVFVTDNKGRSALDYLNLANCGKSPIPEWRTFEGGKCDELDKNDVEQATRVLKAARRRRKN